MEIDLFNFIITQIWGEHNKLSANRCTATTPFIETFKSQSNFPDVPT